MLLPSISELPLAVFVMAVAHHLPSGQVREEPGIVALIQSSGPALLLLCYLVFLALAHPNMEEMKDCCYCACWCAFRLSFRKKHLVCASQVCIQKHIFHCFSSPCYLAKAEWKGNGSDFEVFCRAGQAHTIHRAVMNHSLSSSSLHTAITTLFCWISFYFTGWETSRR